MSQTITPGSDSTSGWIGSDQISVHNGMLFLIMMLNKFSNQQMAAGTAESETIQLLTNVEMKLSTSMMNSLEYIQGEINNIVSSNGYFYYSNDPNQTPVLVPQPNDPNHPPSGMKGYSIDSDTTQAKLQSLNAQYSTTMQDGTINTDTIQGFIQAFQTALQMLMSAMQSMTSMYDSVSSKEAFDASLTAS